MPKIICFIQHHGGQVERQSLETLKGAQDLASELGHQLVGVIFGTGAVPETLTGLKMDELVTVISPELAQYSPDYFVSAMAQVIDHESPELVLAPHTYQIRDWLPRLSARTRKPLVSDCIGYRVNGDITWVRQVFQGKIDVDIRTVPGLVLVSFQSGAFRSDTLEPGAPNVRQMTVDLSDVQSGVSPGERFQESRGTVDLSKAAVIVSIGRGIGKAENLPLAQKLAELLGAELAASRPVVDYGWLPHERQVGSSGQNVSPRLYLALGISGAIQHQVGMKNSDCIIAVNKDPNAPIFEIADYGVVADLLDIVPKLTAVIQEQQNA